MAQTYKKVHADPAGMAGELASTEWMRGLDWCCGIHGAARWRRGMKRGAATARRRYEKRLIAQEMRDV